MKLKEYLQHKNISIEKASEELGFSYENVRRYTAGSVIPRPDNMQKIIEWSGGQVTPNDFYQKEETDKKGEDGNE